MSVSSILLLLLQQSYAGPTADCSGTLIVTVDHGGPDKMSAIDGQFQLLMNDDGTAKMSISAPNMPTLNGTGKETGVEHKPWDLHAVDDGGNQFSCAFTIVEPLVASDIHLYILLELKSTSMMISGPMTCMMK